MIENMKIMIIAYHFPPDAAVGALRPQKFAKYLPEFGWQPYILTIKEKYIEKHDDLRLKDVQGIPITRTSFWRTPLQFLLDLRKIWRKKISYRSTENKIPKALNVDYEINESLRSRIERYLISFNWFPDDKLYWTIPAVIAGYRLLSKEKIKYIYATAPPHTSAIIGLILSKLTGARLIIEFRDPWVFFRQRIPESLRSRLYDVLEKYCENKVIHRAKLIISTTDRLCTALSSHYSEISNNRFVTITNGYDLDDIKGFEINAANEGKYIISYVGTFYLDRNPEIFLKALRKTITEGKIPAENVEVRFIGLVSEVMNKPLDTILTDLNMQKFVTVQGQVPHSEALRQMSEADLLLLLAPNFDDQIPAKTFEYIAFRKPILALTEDGATADLIRDVNAGVVVPQDDLEAVYQALVNFYVNRHNVQQSWYQGVDLSTFERKSLTSSFVEVLNQVK